MARLKLVSGPSLEARMQIEHLQKEIVALQERATEVTKCWNAERVQLRAAQDEVKTTREQFADLKMRLHTEELENARLKGYMERVREDDNVADPLVEVEDAGGKRQVSKRWPSNGYQHNTGMAGCNTDFATGDYGRRAKPQHWTSY